ncbi:MAG: AMP-binding protein, partial [Pseudomonadota bacterium]
MGRGSGQTAWPVNHHSERGEAGFHAKATHARKVIAAATIAAGSDRCGYNFKVIYLEELPQNESVSVPTDSARNFNKIAYLMLTSGTTGTSNCVPISSLSLEHYLSEITNALSIDESSKLTQLFNWCFDLSVHDLFCAITTGAEIFIIPDQARSLSPRIVNTMQISHWFSVPYLANMILANNKDSMPSLKLTAFCGEPLPSKTASSWAERAPNSEIFNLYGPTEATVACSIHKWSRNAGETGGVPIGSPFGKNQWFFRKNQQEIETSLGEGEQAELCIGGPQVFAGYKNNPEKSQRVLQSFDSQRIYVTGDCVYKENGLVFCDGRIDRQIKSRGHRMEPEGIEAFLKNEFSSNEFYVHHHKADDNLHLAIMGGLSYETLHEMKNVVDKVFPAYSRMSDFHYFNQFPEGASGKKDLQKIKMQMSQRLTHIKTLVAKDEEVKIFDMNDVGLLQQMQALALLGEVSLDIFEKLGITIESFCESFFDKLLSDTKHLFSWNK